MKYKNVMVEYGFSGRFNHYFDMHSGGRVYVNNQGNLHIWSGLGDNDSYGFLVKIKSEQHLRDLLDNLGFERREEKIGRP